MGSVTLTIENRAAAGGGRAQERDQDGETVNILNLPTNLQTVSFQKGSDSEPSRNLLSCFHAHGHVFAVCLF